MTLALPGLPNALAALVNRASGLVVSRSFGFALTGLAVTAGAVTYATVAGLMPPWISQRAIFPFLLTADLVIVGLLAVVVTARLVDAWQERRRGEAGSRLHVRLVLLFSLFAIAPTFVLALMSPYFFQVLQENLLVPAKSGLTAASDIVRAGVGEQEAVMRADLGDVAAALQVMTVDEISNRERLLPVIREFVERRPLIEITIIREPDTVLGTALPEGIDASQASVPPVQMLERAAEQAEPVTFIRQGRRAVYSVMQIFTGEKLYLVTGHPVDPTLWLLRQPIEKTREFYEVLDANIVNFQLVVFSVYATIALLMLLSAVSLGITFATRMTRPIGRLMSAAEQVRHGDLTARVEEGPVVDELGELARSFNRMTDQLAAQRQDLEEAYRQLDSRRQLTEAVLEGVSSGVISIDRDGRIERANRPAIELLETSEESLLGRELTDVLPAVVAQGFGDTLARGDGLRQWQVELRTAGNARTVLVRASARTGEPGSRGYVVTFDDVTELLLAQRMAAWGDVARRIAHEIKNPLTPIQLAAERLKRRYLRQIKDDPETFTACTDTIVRQVGDIGRMVDEFSSFARMPRPTLHEEDLKDLCQQALFLQRNALSHIRFSMDTPDQPVLLRCDRRLIGQALTNLLKNAAEAIDGREPATGTELPPGEIGVTLRETLQSATITVSDNGRGLPREDRGRLTEPYVTTRSKGTGLGLAIVKKIMEDHGGALVLDDREGGGASVSLVFRRHSEGSPVADEVRRAAGR